MTLPRSLIPSLILAASMLAAGGAASALKPTRKLSDTMPPLQLEAAIPARFGTWQQLPTSQQGLVNPQSQTLLNQLYAQQLNRSYINDRGEVVMLSIAYGTDQRDNLQAHKPEICYPAQGFQLLSNSTGTLSTTHGDIPVRRLETKLNAQRLEPVTYWLTIGDYHTLGGTDKKIKEMSYSLKGLIPDGLLFRLSTISQDTAHAFAVQESFARDLITQLSTDDRARLAGLHN